MSTEPPTLTPADVEERTRAVFEIWNSLDPDRIIELYTGGHGFGYRTRQTRPPYPSKEAYRAGLDSWLRSVKKYRIAIDEIHTAAEGNVGLAWGFYDEEFETPEGEAVVVHGRFSEVMKRDDDGWRTLLYHRDATPFDERGTYVPPPAMSR